MIIPSQLRFANIPTLARKRPQPTESMCREFGFEITSDPRDPDTCLVKLDVGEARADDVE